MADAGAATGAVPGDLVAVPWAINCRTRDACCAGLTAHCSSVALCTRTLFAVHDCVRAPVGGDWGRPLPDLGFGGRNSTCDGGGRSRRPLSRLR
ncbi:hypothetical protein AB0M68_21200 [Streptomyces sp. NPDC051453]|uniref:hypothetical protein n=1 Tax=Streptomyces sp. NPDC051453 TaxID=3154941 RepID=UPI003444F6DE